MKRIQLFVLLSLLVNGSLSAQTLKIGYADVDYILSLLPEFKQVQSNLQAYEKQLQNQLQAKVQEYQTKLQEYSQNAQNMTEIIRADKEAELKSLQERIQKMERNAQQSLLKKQNEDSSPIIEKVDVAIKDVAKENSFSHIFSAGQAGVNVLLYARDEDNISNLVLKKLGVEPPSEE